jgi:hypothetical protein
MPARWHLPTCRREVHWHTVHPASPIRLGILEQTDYKRLILCILAGYRASVQLLSEHWSFPCTDSPWVQQCDERQLDLEQERKETMALIGLIGGLILCALVFAGLRSMKNAHEATKINDMKLF